MNPRPDVSETRIAQILDAAMEVFAQSGFAQARMDDIAAEAGVAKGTLYLYFKSKDDLIYGLLERFYQRAMAPLPALLAVEGSASERLRLIARLAAAEAQNMLQTMSITLEFYAAAIRQETIQEFLKEYFAQSREMLADLIRQGIDDGEFRPVDADVVALTLGAAFEGLGLFWMVDPESVDWERHTLLALDLFLDGLRAESPASARPGDDRSVGAR